jgi:type IV fimbrial biogenesis protein FimT
MNTRQAGMTLVELIVALAVAIVLMAIGIPAFQNLQATNRAAAQVNTLVTALNLARAEAVGRGTPVTICAKANDADCNTAAAASWRSGWLVVTDSDGSGDVNGNDEVIRAFASLPDNAVIDSSARFARFNTRGEHADGSTVQFRLRQPSAAVGSDRCVRVAPSGQIRTTRGTFDDLASCPP